MKNFLFIAAIVATIPLFAQTPKYYTKAFNNFPTRGTNGNCILLDTDETYYIGGDTRNLVFNWQAYFAQINNSGTVLQFNEMIDSLYDGGIRGMALTDSIVFGCGYVNIGTTTSTTTYFMMKKDGSWVQKGRVGDTLFVNSGYTACRAHDGGFLIGGEIQPYDPPNGQPTHPYLVKLDSTGNKLWDTIYYQYGAPYYAWFWDMKPDPNGNGYYLFGSTQATLGQIANLLLVHIDEDGTILWDKIIDLGMGDYGRKVLLTSDGGYLLVGYQYNTNYLQHYKGLIVKLDSSRNITWINNTAYPEGSMASKCAVETDDGYVLGGSQYKTVPPYDKDACVTKLNPDGSLAWQRTHDRAAEDDYTYDMLATPDGSYLLCGRTESYDDTLGVYRADVLLLKVNCMGLQTLPQAMFINSSIDTNYLCVFQNLSQHTYPDSTDGGHYIWNFGDDTPPLQTTTDAFIPHYYPNYGSYRVSLTAIVCNDTSTYTQTINLWATGTNQVLPLEGGLEGGLYTVLPNPAQDYLIISSQTSATNATFVLYDVLGREQLRQNLSSPSFGGKGEATIATEHLPSGIYLYQIINPQNQTLQHGKLSILH